MVVRLTLGQYLATAENRGESRSQGKLRLFIEQCIIFVVITSSFGMTDDDIFSTGGTKKSLEAAGVKIHSISELTGFPEILDGRVKTLHPAVHGGILARRNLPQYLSQLSQHHIELIDMVAVNLYPFVETVTRAEVSLDEALENIDIG